MAIIYRAPCTGDLNVAIEQAPCVPVAYPRSTRFIGRVDVIAARASACANLNDSSTISGVLGAQRVFRSLRTGLMELDHNLGKLRVVGLCPASARALARMACLTRMF